MQKLTVSLSCLLLIKLLTLSPSNAIAGWFLIPQTIPMSHDATEEHQVEIEVLVYHQEVFEPEDRFPGIILVPGWAGTVEDLESTATEFANRGYNVLTYTPRGFGNSLGQTDVAGPLDSADFLELLAWFVGEDDNGNLNTNTDPDRVGTGLISYGALIPLNALPHTPNIAAIALIDAPATIYDAFFSGQTANAVWPSLLETLGQTDAGEDGFPDEIPELLNNFLNYENIDDVLAWSQTRSIFDPAPERSEINYRAALIKNLCAPIFISNNYRDRMFRPNSMLNFFNALIDPQFNVAAVDFPEGYSPPELNSDCSENFPAILQWHDGLHGFTNNDDFRMGTYFDWFDHHLKGATNGVDQLPRVSMQVHGTNTRANYQTWPIPERIETQTYYIHPTRRSGREGGILETPYTEERQVKLNSSEGQHEDLNPSTGFAIIDAQVDVTRKVDQFIFSRHLFYQSARLDKNLQLRGAPKISLHATLPPGDSQVVVYLYHLVDDNTVKMITHGAQTFLDAADQETQLVEIELNAIAYDFQAGNRWVIAIDTFDFQFSKPSNNAYAIHFDFSEDKPAMVTLPIDIQEPPEIVTSENEAEEQGEETEERSLASGSSSVSSGSLSFIFSTLLLAFIFCLRINRKALTKKH